MKYGYFQCLKPTCGFRFPAPKVAKSYSCPKCGSPTKSTLDSEQDNDSQASVPAPSVEIVVLLDNIRSAHNVGSIFRTADGAGVSQIILTGITPTPDHPGARKTALGAEIHVPWIQAWSALETCQQYLQKGYHLLVLEKTTAATPLFQTSLESNQAPVLFVVGNEIGGVDPNIRDLAHKILFIPMLGIKESLNVSVAFGIAIYWLRFAH